MLLGTGAADHGSTVSPSGRYKAGDSMMYHGSMFLKRLSDVHGDKTKEHAQHGWRDKLGHFLESKPEQWFIFGLICIDLLVIFVQLFVIEPHLSCHPPQTPTVAPTPTPTGHAAMLSNPDHSSSEHHDTNEAYELAEKWLTRSSLAILSILAAEIILLLVAFDIRFFKQPLYILDALVISASLVIEITEPKLQHHGTGEARSMANLLMIFRLWRIVRIIHGIAMSVQERSEEHIKELEAELEKLTKEKTHVETKFDYLKKKYKKLAEAHEEIHFRKDLEDNEDLLGNTPRPTPSLPPFESPGAPHIHNIVNARLDNKKIRISASAVGGDSDEEDGDIKERSITINDDVGDSREARRPLIDRAVRTAPPNNNEYSTFKHRRN